MKITYGINISNQRVWVNYEELSLDEFEELLKMFREIKEKIPVISEVIEGDN